MLTTTTLILKSLRHHWRVNVPVALAAGVGVAILAGSFLVGASVRESLRTLAVQRLGAIGQALLSDVFFREDLAAALPGSEPAILLSGSATNPADGGRAANLQVVGVRPSFWNLAEPEDRPDSPDASRTVILNRDLADELAVQPGDEILLSMLKPDAIARESFMGRRDGTVVTMRLEVVGVAPSRGLGGLSLRASQQRTWNAFVPLETLQRSVEREGLANALFAPVSGDKEAFSDMIAKAARLEDAGLRLRRKGGRLCLESDRLFLDDYAVQLADEAEAALDATTRSDLKRADALAYLVNAIRLNGRATPYSTAVGLGGSLVEQARLNTWAMQDLGAQQGDLVTIEYFVDGPDGSLVETSATLALAAPLDMNTPAVSADFVPAFPGVSDSETMGDWDAPFPLEMHRIRPQDDEYWERYRTTPKLVLPIEQARGLWSNRYGDTTSIVWSLRGADGGTTGSASPLARLEDAIRERFHPEAAGLVLRDIRAEQLEAASGSSDFGGLFIGFSLFLLVAAAMLIQILFRLGVEARSRQIGLLGAVGFTPQQIRRMLLTEGAILAAAGGLFGCLLAAGYSALLVHGLNTWWVGAIGRGFVEPAWSPPMLTGGFAGGWLVAMLSVWGAARRVCALSARDLLAGASPGEENAPGRGRRWSLIGGGVLLAGSIALLKTAGGESAHADAGLFYAVGAALLAACLLFLRAWLVGSAPRSADEARRRARALTLTRLGAANSRRRHGRSLLVAGLVATATFLIVAVGANRFTVSGSTGRDSGTGGLALIAESAVPIFRPVREILAERPGGDVLPEEARLYSFRLRGGDDPSCLNLYRATEPRVLGVPEAFIERGGFRFGNLLRPGDEQPSENPWALLDQPADEDGAIPAFGDYTTVYWLLHRQLGDAIEVGPAKVRIVGLLRKSIFQSELLIAEKHFETVYPDVSGRRWFAIDASPENPVALRDGLENALADYGFDATSARERLEALAEVENTYLSTFQALGGLGLMLGTLGLALALARNLFERRRELALMRALGFTSGPLLWLAVAENLWLIAAGMASGVFCALVTVAPGLVLQTISPPWASLAVTLCGVFAFAMAATVVCAAFALRTPALEVLKREA